MLALKTLLNIAHCMGGILGTAWLLVLGTMEMLHSVLYPSSKPALVTEGGAAPSGASTEKKAASSVRFLLSRYIIFSSVF